MTPLMWVVYANGQTKTMPLPDPSKQPPGVLIEGIPGLGPLRVFRLTDQTALGHTYTESTVHFLSTETP